MFFDRFGSSLFILAVIVLAVSFKAILKNRSASTVVLFCCNAAVLSLLLPAFTLAVLVGIASFCYLAALAIARRRPVDREGSMENLALSLVVLTFAFGVIRYPWLKDLISRTKFVDFTEVSGVIEAIGISYVFFRCVHVLVDAYRGTLGELRFLTFLNYVFFFPTFLAGPIERYQVFARWQRRSFTVQSTKVLFFPAITKLTVGAVKRILLVPLVVNYAIYIHEVKFVDVYLYKVLISLVAYSIYLYLDFSALSDIAIGTSYLLGIRVRENFSAPYLAANISEFWKRWHMSLSSILRDYLFVPFVKTLSSRTGGRFRLFVTICGYLVTFTLCGMWHGSGWNYLIWGLWHGLGLSVFAIWKSSSAPGLIQRLPKVARGLTHSFAVVVTFCFVTFGWLFFQYPWDRIGEIWTKVHTSEADLPAQ